MALKFTFLGLLLLLAVTGSPASAEDPVCPETSVLSRASFPNNILWGAASAAFQYEGAAEEGCRGPSLWDHYTLKHPEKANHDNASIAVDFYHRYKEDIQLLKGLGFDSFRLSISWTRIFPHGRKDKGVSKVGVQFYHDLLDELLANGITPLVTVFHWDTPQDLEDEYGGFLSERIVKDYVEFANFTFHEYCGKAKFWATFNEPWVYSRAGYDTGKKAPGRCSPYIKEDCLGGQSGIEAYIVSHNLLVAHAEAVYEFRKCEKCKGGKIGIAHSPAWFEPHDLQGHPHPEASVERALEFIMGWHVHPTTFGDYPEIMKKLVGKRLPAFTEEQKAKLKNSCDYVGFNYYSSFFAVHTEAADPEKPSWQADSLVQWDSKNAEKFSIGSKPSTAMAAVYAEGLRKLLKYIKEKYNDPEIIITENGYGEILGDLDKLPDALNDYNRKYYLQRHLLSLHEAVCEDKVKLIGYYLWSLLDNFEWQDGYSSRFGIYYVDYKNNLTRHEKESAKWMRKFLQPAGTASSKIKKDEL